MVGFANVNADHVLLDAARICSVIWYLGHSRHQCNQVNVTDRLMSSIHDASCETDSDDDSD